MSDPGIAPGSPGEGVSEHASLIEQSDEDLLELESSYKTFHWYKVAFWLVTAAFVIEMALFIGFASSVRFEKRHPPLPENYHFCDASPGLAGGVSTTNSIGTEVGAWILENGNILYKFADGNVFDAAIAIQMILAVVQPQSTGLGGGCFILYQLENGVVEALDGREEAPNRYHPNIFCNTSISGEDCITQECNCTSGTPWEYSKRSSGVNSVGVPGVVHAMWTLYQTHASGRFTWAELLQHARDLAADGFEISAHLYDKLKTKQAKVIQYPSTRDLYYSFEEGEWVPKQAGTIMTNPGMAKTIQLLQEAMDPIEAFYGDSSEIRTAILNLMNDSNYSDSTTNAPGMLTEVLFLKNEFLFLLQIDFEMYSSVYRTPLKYNFSIVRYEPDGFYERKYHTAYGFPLPSSGGFVLNSVMKSMELTNVATYTSSDVNYFSQFINAQDIAFADRNNYLGDEDFVNVPWEGMNDAEYIAERFGSHSPATKASVKKSTGSYVPAGNPWKFQLPTSKRREKIKYAENSVDYDRKGTTHISLADQFGNIMSFTTTIEDNLGCGVVVPGYGFLLNNEMTDFNPLGYNSSGYMYPNAPEGGKKIRRSAHAPLNETYGGKRPLSSMSPTIAISPTGDKLTLGSPGGSRIPGSVLNVLVAYYGLGMKIQAATNLSRIVSRNSPSGALYEETFNPFLVNELNYRDYNMVPGFSTE